MRKNNLLLLRTNILFYVFFLDTGNDGGFSPEAVDTSNTFGDDMLQMALKMATELDEPAVDLEGALTANTITASQTADQTGGNNIKFI